MFRPAFAVLLVVAALGLSADKNRKLDWQWGTVMSSKFDLRIDSNTAADGRTGGTTQIGHERIRLQAADGTTYDAEQWAPPSKLIRALEGVELVFAMDGKYLTVKTPDGTRKLRMVEAVPVEPRP